MSEYYFFHDEDKGNRIIKWFKQAHYGVIILTNLNPVLFILDGIMYTIKYIEDPEKIYCTRLYGGCIVSHHIPVINEIEKFLNELKNEN